MKTSDFSYDLPPGRIAQQPRPARDESRMLVVHRRGQQVGHRRFGDLPRFLRAGDVLVLNDTRVIPARLFGTKVPTGGKVELLVLEETGPGLWDVLLRASRRPRPGEAMDLAGGRARATLVRDGVQGRATVRVESDRPFLEILDAFGLPPLPPYIKRTAARPGEVAADRERYQTVYARHAGAVAAPTAGLHFTRELLERLEEQGVRRAAVTLHVGPGTFRPVITQEVEDHEMEAERYEVTEEAARAVREAVAAGGRVVAVGSTTVRTLETVAAEHGGVCAGRGRTRLFIYPPYTFRAVDAMLTNFHLPESTLLMMVCAFGGRDLILRAYEEAVREQYRFYSYGDCMLIV